MPPLFRNIRYSPHFSDAQNCRTWYIGDRGSAPGSAWQLTVLRYIPSGTSCLLSYQRVRHCIDHYSNVYAIPMAKISPHFNHLWECSLSPPAFLPRWRMQTRSSDENSVCLSVKRINCDKTGEKSVQILCMPYEPSFLRRMVGGGYPFYLKFWVKPTALDRNRWFSVDIRS